MLDKKCGEIIFHGSDNTPSSFSFICVFCNKVSFTEISDFFDHFKESHMKSFILVQNFRSDEIHKPKTRKTQFNSGGFEIASNSVAETLKANSEPITTKRNRRKIGSFTCKKCEKEFCIESSLRRHVRLVHSSHSPRPTNQENEINEKNDILFICTSCESFPSQEFLEHMENDHQHLKSLVPYSVENELIEEESKLGNLNEKQESIEEAHSDLFNKLSENYHHQTLKISESIKPKILFGTPCSNDFNDEDKYEEHELIEEESILENLNEKEEINIEEIVDSDSFITLSDNKFILENIHVRENGLFECRKCNKCYSHRPTIRRHIKDIHLLSDPETGEKRSFSIICTICGREQSSYKHLKMHMIYDHPQSVQSLESENLKLQSPSKLNNDDDDQEVNADEDNNISTSIFAKEIGNPKKCRFCTRVFKKKHARIVHERTHTGETPFKCRFCKKSFRFESYVKSHENMHLGIKPHKCTMCEAAFTSKSNLNQHIRRHLGDKKLPCSYCGKLFQENSERKSHERTHTGEKPFLCSKCGNCYTTSEQLFRHNLRHANIKRYKCEYCEIGFFTKDRLESHVLVHTREKPFECKLCNEKFSTKRNFKYHLVNHSVCPSLEKDSHQKTKS